MELFQKKVFILIFISFFLNYFVLEYKNNLIVNLQVDNEILKIKNLELRNRNLELKNLMKEPSLTYEKTRRRLLYYVNYMWMNIEQVLEPMIKNDNKTQLKGLLERTREVKT